jgi:hypothetical protein
VGGTCEWVRNRRRRAVSHDSRARRRRGMVIGWIIARKAMLHYGFMSEPVAACWRHGQDWYIIHDN